MKSPLIALGFIALFGVLAAVPSNGGLVTTTGKEWHLWTDDHYCVIAAHIREIHKAEGDAGRFGVWVATLEPLAVFAGTFDPSERPSFQVSVYIGGAGTSIQDAPPKKGATILAVLQNGNFIVSDVCWFMPDHSAMVEVKGLGDPRVMETIKAIHDAREHAKPDPHLRPSPTSKPAASESNAK